MHLSIKALIESPLFQSYWFSGFLQSCCSALTRLAESLLGIPDFEKSASTFGIWTIQPKESAIYHLLSLLTESKALVLCLGILSFHPRHPFFLSQVTRSCSCQLLSFWACGRLCTCAALMAKCSRGHCRKRRGGSRDTDGQSDNFKGAATSTDSSLPHEHPKWNFLTFLILYLKQF